MPTVPMGCEWNTAIDAFVQINECLLDVFRLAAEAHPETVVDEAFREIRPLRDGAFCRPRLLEGPLAVFLGCFPPIAVVKAENDRKICRERRSGLPHVFRIRLEGDVLFGRDKKAFRTGRAIMGGEIDARIT